MIERGKYQSLTMVNWNGFFARTFDIDEMVTTLSGGNGAGKSTTMAAFITALIPDQSLLHFRNTTEAGSSQASRDKGLFGKLQPGVCFAALDVVNSKKQRTVFAVRLQQVAGRDKKVDIKPFVIQGLPSSVKPTDVLIEALSNQSARVRPLNEVKEAVAQLEGVTFKAFNSVVDYHTYMFDFGVLPKKLRNGGDRSKYYRLIEASLYGGISSAITRSLRDYLLPQNGGVKKAFQDMESALRENRLTLDAIKTTQADRDLFKHLITESTNYVASDYMRHSNDRKQRLDKVLSLRKTLFSTRNKLIKQHQSYLQAQEELELVVQQETDLELDHQSASDHLQLVQTAIKQKEKIERYLEDLEELNERLEEQTMVVEQSQESLLICEEETMQAEEEVDSLQMQLADYQQALDVQQTRALQYQQALEVLQQAKESLSMPDLVIEQVPAVLNEQENEEKALTEKLLSLKHQLDISSAAVEQYQTSFKLLAEIYPEVTREEAAEKARLAVLQLKQAQAKLGSAENWQAQYKELQRESIRRQQAIELSQRYHQLHSISIEAEETLELEQERTNAQMELMQDELASCRDERVQKSQQIDEQRLQQKMLEAKAPAWLKANDALEQLREQTGEELADHQAVIDQMQLVLEQERIGTGNKLALATKRDQLEEEIEQLASPGGANDSRIKGIAESLGGVLLSEIYDDITLEDAPYFSAMYGPARHAVVVSDLSSIQDKLTALEECPDDLYIIEGDVDAFDDSTFDAQELEGAVCVQFSDRQLRYSRLPKTPLFGRAAREQRLTQLRDSREAVLEEFAKSAFDSQKLNRLYQSFNQFVSSHITRAFDADPEQSIRLCRDKANQLQREIETIEGKEKQYKSQIEQCKASLNLLDKLSPLMHYLADDQIEVRVQNVQQQLEDAQKANSFVAQHEKRIELLESSLPVLASDPEQYQEVEKAYIEVEQKLQSLKRQNFLLADLKERRNYFAYQDSAYLLEQSSELTEQLKIKLTQAESLRRQKREVLKQSQSQFSQCQQVFASLKSANQAKAETVKEFQDEFSEFGVSADESAQERAVDRKTTLLEQLHSTRQRKSDYQRTLTATELEIKSLSKGLKQSEKEYKELRTVAILSKSGWCDVIRMAKDNDVERRLYRRELAYLSADELRSMSDKSLGALRLAVADNEDLRDALRASEENAYPERKVLFYIAVYQHLKQRIRQDIIRTDDPVEAIEEMEVELARLSEELTLRENRLAISSDSVAAIIKKTIQREQNRIRMLNQGLSNINFGQVKGVRLNVRIRESHDTLLNGLVDQNKQHRDLFESARLTFSEAMAKLFQRVNPHIDMGQRSPQVLGEELLDYRNYLELSVEVNRGTDGWLKAESGALSTGEAIGTGQSILLMVVQSWEEESRRLRSKDIIPCRLLFLDEAARLDAKSINTLFELCDRLGMQLLIAAPENISPEQGTTYKLVRKVFKDHEHVHVVGLKGFAHKVSQEVSLIPEMTS